MATPASDSLSLPLSLSEQKHPWAAMHIERTYKWCEIHNFSFNVNMRQPDHKTVPPQLEGECPLCYRERVVQKSGKPERDGTARKVETGVR
jgi:hypothetical protein